MLNQKRLLKKYFKTFFISYLKSHGLYQNYLIAVRQSTTHERFINHTLSEIITTLVNDATNLLNLQFYFGEFINWTLNFEMSQRYFNKSLWDINSDFLHFYQKHFKIYTKEMEKATKK